MSSTMPTIQEIMEESGRGSDETSLQISTSPEQVGKALHVRKTSTKGSRSSSASSSNRRPSGRAAAPKALMPPAQHRNKSRARIQKAQVCAVIHRCQVVNGSKSSRARFSCCSSRC